MDRSYKELEKELHEEYKRKLLLLKKVKAEKAAGRIKCLGRGPNALWKKKRTRDIIKSQLK